MTEPPASISEALAGRCTLDRELGRGGMATVYLATDLKHQRQVALKVLRPELAAVLGGERFLREITLTAGLHHPHILPLLDSGEAAGFLFYTMPFVAGESLRQRLTREKQLPVEEALRITREVADALDYAHRQGIIHRDIKPENILLEGGHALVADFGIARAVSATDTQKLTETGLAIGTPGYMSPEQATATKEIDGRTDIYSLGCVLYEMLVGETPFTGPSAQVVLARKLNEPLPRISVARETVPPAVEQAVARALARLPADRYQTAAEFGAALAPGSLASYAPVTRRIPARRWVVPAAAAVLLTVAVALVVPRLRSRQTISPIDAPREPVLVVPFEVKAADPALADAGTRLATEITDAIAQEGIGTVAAAGDGTAPGGAPADHQRLARQSKAATLVTGTIYQRGDSVEVQARLLRGSDLAPVFALPVERGAIAQSAAPLEGTRRRVLGAVAYYLSPGMRGRDASLYRPPSSPEVFRLAMKAEEGALRALPQTPDGGGDSDVASRYRAAYSADTTHLGYVLQFAWWVIDGGRRDAALGRLAPRRGELTRGEALLLDYELARYTGPEEQYRAALAGFAADPLWWRQPLIRAAMNDGRPAEALRYYQGRDTTSSFRRAPETWADAVAPVLHALGRFEEQLQVAREAGREQAGAGFAGITTSSFSLAYQVDALAALGRLDELDSLITLASADQFLFAGVVLMGEARRELCLHQRCAAGRPYVDRAIEWLERQRLVNGNDRLIRLNMLANLYYTAGRYREAKTIGDSISAGFYAGGWGNLARLSYSGRVAARLGDTATALRAVDSLLADPPRWMLGDHQFTAGIILGLLGQRERAVALMRLGLNSGARLLLIYPERGTVDFENLEDYPPFQALVRRKDGDGGKPVGR
jgi:TolB-like protein